MSYRALAWLSVALLVLALAVSPSVYAQAVSTGTIIGQVTDPSGASVAGASVTLTDVTTNATRSTTTNADGRYIMVNVPPGTYNVSVKQSGFREAKFTNQTVTVGTQLTLNAKLEVGVATEVVEVTAAQGAELQTLNSTVGTSFSGVALDSLPSITRESSAFVALQPGVTPEGSVTGAVQDQNTFQLDGGQNTNDMDGAMNIYTPSFSGDPSGVATNALGTGLPTGVLPTPIDSIEEFKVGTTQQTADFNSSAGAQVQMVTRRGHDSWHGTAYEYYLDNDWNGNSFDNNANGVPIPDYHYSRFGAAGGGPIIPKKILGGKTYFFGNYEGFRFPNAATVNKLVPGPALSQGLLAFDPCTAQCDTTVMGNVPVFTPVVFNITPGQVTYNGPTLTFSNGQTALVSNGVYDPGQNTPAGGAGLATTACVGTTVGALNCNPRALGVSPTMQSLFALLPAATTTGCGGLGATYCDGINTQQFTGNVGVTQRSDFAVARIDHDFGDKEHFFSTYRFYRLTRATTNQVELLPTGSAVALANRPQIPWFLATGLTSNLTPNFTNDFHYSYLRNWWLWGDIGAPPQLAGLGAALEPNGEQTSNALTPYNINTQQVRTRYWDGQDHMIRDDMTRLLGNHLLQWGGIYQHNFNQHQRSDNGGGINYFPVDQLGSTSTLAFGTFPGATTYIPGIFTQYSQSIPGTAYNAFNGSIINYWKRDYGDALGLLTTDQVAFTRNGPQLTLNNTLQPVTDRSTIPYYNVYFTDSWHIRPTITLTYGLAWTLEMPPHEANGEQVILVDSANQPIYAQSYLKTRAADAKLGTVFNPNLGFSLVGNAGGGMKYPYNPYYGQFSPRLAVAWSPNYDSGILGTVFGRSKTVVRGGFAEIFGRLNGVNLVLVPLLGTGLIQPVQCVDPLMGGTCGGSGGASPITAFRIGPTGSGFDGLTGPLASATPTLPQPVFPGINNTVAATSDVLDPNFRPNKSYEMNFTIQRQISSKFTVEVGYIGRIIRNEYQPLDLNAVPYMFTCGGAITSCPGAGSTQQFQNAYANLVLQYCGGTTGLAGGNCAGVANPDTLTPQPFFEAALGGAASAYCSSMNPVTMAPYASCTAAVAGKEGNSGTGNLSQQLVYNLWSDLDNGKFVFGRTMENTPFNPAGMFGANGQLTSGVATNSSLGFGNYNGLFISTRMSDWHGLTMQSNFTWSKTLGTGALYQAASEYTTVDPYNIDRAYGPQAWDRKFDFNVFLVYQPPFYKSQQGVIGHLLGGWSIAPIFTTESGIPLTAFPSSYNFNTGLWGQAFGEADNINYYTDEQAVLVPGPGCSNFSTTQHNNILPIGGADNSVYSLNLYKTPGNVINCFRNAVLGFDNGHNGGYGSILRGQPSWNMDLQIRKVTHITERISGEFQVAFYNVFNHNQMADPFNALDDPGDWGQLEGQLNTPRQFEFGFRVRF